MTHRFFAALALAVLPFPALAGDIEAQDAFARATAPGAKVGGAFMTFVNHGEDTRLVAATSDASREVQLHTHTMDANGVMRMREVEGGIPLPAGETVELRPGGLHIMLIGLHDRLAEGESVDLTLEFADGTQMPMTLPVRSIAAKPMQMQGHGAGHGMKHGDMKMAPKN